MCYGNIKDAYKACDKPPLGCSDHNTIHLIPSYRQKLKTGKVESRTIKVWDTDATEQLQGCFACTSWDVITEGCTDIDQITDVITSYIKFCVDSIIPTKTIKVYPNNKPWVTKEMKTYLNLKKIAYQQRDIQKLKDAQRDINNHIRKCKMNFKEKVESAFHSNNMRRAWQGVATMVGAGRTKNQISVQNPQSYANELNAFYTRFETHDFSAELNSEEERLRCWDKDSISISEDMVRNTFNNINIRKSCGPDGIQGKILKSCSDQLAPVFCKLYQKSLDTTTIPKLWKMSEIIPVPKKTKCTQLNDYRPVALTSLLMKCFERLLLRFLLDNIRETMDQLQFAYRAKRGVEDALITMLDKIYNHLELPNSYVRILFADFSSAFNTIQPHLLIEKLINTNVNSKLILWISNFLTNRQQYVRVNDAHSSIATTNTGAPQGCVMSPVLFTTYTNECTAHHPDCLLVKFADDASLVALITNSENNYRGEIVEFKDWCDKHYLQLNVAKTKEMTIDFRTKKDELQPVMIDGEEVERVTEYKYLGTVIDNKLNWNANTTNVYNKCQQRLFFLRKLRSFQVETRIMFSYYKCFIQSVLTFSLQAWFGSLTLRNRNKLSKIVNISSKIAGTPVPRMEDIYHDRVLSLASKVVSDPTHVLNMKYVLLPSRRRYLVPKLKSKRAKCSFIPTSILLLNEPSDKIP